MIQKIRFEKCPAGKALPTRRGGISGFFGVRRQSGFTLIEILMAMTIFSASFLALAAGASTVMRSNHTSYNDTVATTLAQDKLEELMAGTALPDCNNFNKNGCNETVPTTSSVTFTRSWRITPDQPVAGVTRIEIRLDWNDHTDHSLTVTSAVDI